jgi:hypothetical protein
LHPNERLAFLPSINCIQQSRDYPRYADSNTLQLLIGVVVNKIESPLCSDFGGRRKRSIDNLGIAELALPQSVLVALLSDATV